MKCISTFLTRNKDGEIVEVPCGYCIYCKRKRVNDIMIRCLTESIYHEYNTFATLTYDERNNPGELVKRDLQLFNKRLRADGYKYKYIMCGEYGGNTKRPHYHAIFFGLGVNDEQAIKDNWNLGFVSVSEANTARYRYLAKYVLKSVNGRLETEVYGDKQKPFLIMSKGLSRQYINDNAEQLCRDKFIRIGRHKFQLPRFFLINLGIDYKIEAMRVQYENKVSYLEHKYPGITVDKDMIRNYPWSVEEFRRYERVSAQVKSLLDLRGEKL